MKLSDFNQEELKNGLKIKDYAWKDGYIYYDISSGSWHNETGVSINDFVADHQFEDIFKLYDPKEYHIKKLLKIILPEAYRYIPEGLNYEIEKALDELTNDN